MPMGPRPEKTEPFEAVLPTDRQGLMDGPSYRLDAYEGLATWWRQAETVWEQHRSRLAQALAAFAAGGFVGGR